MKLFGIDLVDAGQKIEKPKEGKGEMAMTSPDDPSVKDGKRYATVHIDSKEVPAIKGKEVKDRCVMVAIVDVVRRTEQETQREGKEAEEEVTAQLRLVQVGFKPYKGKSAEEMSDAELDEGAKGKEAYDGPEKHVSRKEK